jgi:two-component system, OmpR family, KDP operon response regulator KdpE
MSRSKKAQKARILVVTTEPQIRKLLKSIFTVNGYQVLFASEATAAIHTAVDPELVIIDLDPSNLHGCEAILEMRRCSDIPIIVLSGQHREADLVAALDLGADDYLEKPFRTGELLARARAALRRGFKAHGEQAVYRCGDLRIDILDHRVTRSSERIGLSPTEFEILSLLVRSAGRVVPYQRIYESLSDSIHCQNKQALRSSIWSLRQKIEEVPDDPKIVLTEERIGYRLANDPWRPRA